MKRIRSEKCETFLIGMTQNDFMGHFSTSGTKNLVEIKWKVIKFTY